MNPPPMKIAHGEKKRGEGRYSSFILVKEGMKKERVLMHTHTHTHNIGAQNTHFLFINT